MEPAAEAPQMDAGYGLRGTPGEGLGWATVEQWLRAARSYWLCTTRADGRPHAKPVWGVWLDGAVLFATSARSVGGRNIGRSPEVVVHLESGDEVAILEGTVERPDETSMLEQFADAYERKYDLRPQVDDPEAPVFSVRPRTVLSWTEADFPGTATRWRF